MFLCQHNLCCFLFNFKLYSFYGFHFTVQALVSAPPPTLHTLFMQLLISINYHSLLVCRLLQVMLFLWVPLYSSMLLCQHNHQHYTHCSFFACLLFKFCSFLWVPLYSSMLLCQHNHQHYTHCSFFACLLFKLCSFLWVPLLLCRLFCQHHHRHYTHSSCSCLSVSTIIFCLFVVFTYAIFMGATLLYRH